jgi:hypothetical protein
MTTIEQLAGITAQHNEIVKRVANGSLDAEQVKDSLQAIIEKREPRGITIATSHQRFQSESSMPDWYVSPEQQLERVTQLNRQRDWGFEESDFPAIPEGASLRDGEVLLLCVYLPTKGRKSGLYRTIDELWDAYEAPSRYIKRRWSELKAEPKLVRQAPGYTYTPGIRWVVFNPNSYHGKSPEQALELAKQDNVQLAGVEGLMANLLFPAWATSWNGTSGPYPWLTGLQYKDQADWSLSLCFYRWDDDRQVNFSAHWSDFVFSVFGSPSFREC